MVAAAVLLPGFWSRIAVFLALIFGYALSWLTDIVVGPVTSVTGDGSGEEVTRDRIDWSAVSGADWIGLPGGTLPDGVSAVHAPSFSLTFVLLVLPGVIALIAENTGHVRAVGEMTGDDLDPYMGRALAGDGLATAFASAFGGSPTTTYAENIGVMSATRVYSTAAYYVAASVAIVLGLSPKFGAVVNAIPGGVLGGITLVLYGMIGLIGAKIWVENNVDFGNPINLVGLSAGIIAGIGGVTLQITDDFELGGIALGSILVIAYFHMVKGRKEELGAGEATKACEARPVLLHPTERPSTRPWRAWPRTRTPRCSPGARAWSRCCRCAWPRRAAWSTSTAWPSWPACGWTRRASTSGPWPGTRTSRPTPRPGGSSRCSPARCDWSPTRPSATAVPRWARSCTPTRPRRCPWCSCCSEGHVTAASTQGTRTIDAADLYVGPLETTLRHDEIATGAFFPALPDDAGVGFDEISRRHGDYALCGVAAVVHADESGAVTSVRAGYLSVSEVPVVVDLSEVFASGAVDDRSLDDAAELALASLEPEGDIHATAAYRATLARVLTRRVVRQAHEDCLARRAGTSTGGDA